MSNVSAAHISATLAKAGYPRWTAAAETDSGYAESGFYVRVDRVENLGPTVIVAYGDEDYVGQYGNEVYRTVARIVEKALDGYTRVLRQHGYTVENWMRYDGVRLGLFVTGREG